jgi:hypothetical protein
VVDFVPSRVSELGNQHQEVLSREGPERERSLVRGKLTDVRDVDNLEIDGIRLSFAVF